MGGAASRMPLHERQSQPLLLQSSQEGDMDPAFHISFPKNNKELHFSGRQKHKAVSFCKRFCSDNHLSFRHFWGSRSQDAFFPSLRYHRPGYYVFLFRYTLF